MKVLKTVQWSLAVMGYSSSQKHTLSMKQVRHGLEALLILILHYAYLLHVANTIQQYVFSTFMTITMTGIFISFMSTANKTATIFIFIERTEKLINEGKILLHEKQNKVWNFFQYPSFKFIESC